MQKEKANGQTGTKILLDAISKDKVHLARFVLDALDGEIVNSRTDDGRTPLIWSVLQSDSGTRCKFVELLLERGASVNGRDGARRTALSHACERGYLDAVKVLVRHGADPDAEDEWGNTALMYAAAAGHPPVVEYLVRAFKKLGLQLERTNRAGNSAAEVAKLLGHHECVCALTNSCRTRRACERGTHGDHSSEEEIEQLAQKLQVLQSQDQGKNFMLKPTRRMRLIYSIEEDRSQPAPAPQRKPLAPDDLVLPPLKHTPELRRSTFFSPQPSRHSLQLDSPPIFGTLLTPIFGRESLPVRGVDKCPSLLSFKDAYYKKRFSLPASALTPAHPERALVRKIRTFRAGGNSSVPHAAAPAPPAAASLSTLSTKLLRRFTSPEIQKNPSAPGQEEEESVPRSGRIPRSETFPRDIGHPPVDSTASIDSISSVRCEFDFRCRHEKE